MSEIKRRIYSSIKAYHNANDHWDTENVNEYVKSAPSMTYMEWIDEAIDAQDSELASLKSELEDYRVLVRAVVASTVPSGEWNTREPFSAFLEAWWGAEFDANGLPIFTPALRSALKAAVEGGKA